jgi:hypothetical protein
MPKPIKNSKELVAQIQNDAIKASALIWIVSLILFVSRPPDKIKAIIIVIAFISFTGYAIKGLYLTLQLRQAVKREKGGKL